jgi:hypothetical protein
MPTPAFTRREHRLTHKFSADEPCDGDELGRNSTPRIHHDRLLERRRLIHHEGGARPHRTNMEPAPES